MRPQPPHAGTSDRAPVDYSDLVVGDEGRPVCGNCEKSNRVCRPPRQQGTTFREYYPGRGPRRERGGLDSRCEDDLPIYNDSVTESTEYRSPDTVSPGDAEVESEASDVLSPLSRNVTGRPTTSAVSITTSGASMSISQLLQSDSESPPLGNVDRWSLASSPHSGPVTRVLASHEARFVHHYAVHLGRWLDCTDASRQFTLKMPALVSTSPILLEAVVSFAARHLGDAEAADAAHDRCIGMLIVLLGSDSVCSDDVLLCAIVILRVFEQLTGTVTSLPIFFSDQENLLNPLLC